MFSLLIFLTLTLTLLLTGILAFLLVQTGLFIKKNIGYINTSDVVKSEGLELAEEAVKKRISKSRVRRLSNK